MSPESAAGTEGQDVDHAQPPGRFVLDAIEAQAEAADDRRGGLRRHTEMRGVQIAHHQIDDAAKLVGSARPTPRTGRTAQREASQSTP
jgi:hypothetical protein